MEGFLEAGEFTGIQQDGYLDISEGFMGNGFTGGISPDWDV